MGAQIGLGKPRASDPERATRLARLYDRALEVARASYDADRHLLWQPAADGSGQRTYRQAASLPLAHALLSEGAEEGIAEAEAIIEAVLASQELHPGHPHRGNWLWLADDVEVVDLNAVQFVLRGLLPLLVRQGHRLSEELLTLCRERVRLALEEVERLAVAPTYTNIHLQSLLALMVGGEWLGDARFSDLGKERWARWAVLTVANGAPHEYNSPNYGGIDLSALAGLIGLVRDPTVRFQAQLLYERLWLHLGLHLHRPTRQVAGPHCRCYWQPMLSGQGPLKDLLWRETGWAWLLEPGASGGHQGTTVPASLEMALTEHWLPSYLAAWMARQENLLPSEIRETANRDLGYDLTTFFTRSYALGTASRTYAIGTDCFYIEHQANYMLLYYVDREQRRGWDMVYSRYVVNDRHLGSLAAAPDRPRMNNFYDQGNFAGVQLRNKAIALYALMPQAEEVHSLKTVVVFQTAKALRGIWANAERVELDDLPCALHAGDWLLVEAGQVYIGVLPLEPSCLGREAPIVLERGPLGELWLTIYNYRGPAKRFWEYASLGGAFWRGNIKAGYVVEVAERDDYLSPLAFLYHLRQARVTDEVDACHTRTVTYASGGDELALCYDLWRTQPVERRLQGRSYRSPHLSSPLAVQGDGGELAAGDARLLTQPQPMWLVAQELAPGERTYVVVNPQAQPTALRLETPCGTVTAEGFGMGRLEWTASADDEQSLFADVLSAPASLHAPDHVSVRVRVHGRAAAT